MTATLPEPVVREMPPGDPQPHDHFTDSLQDRLPEWFRAPKAFFGFSAVVAFLFLWFNFQPIWHTDVWGHLAYGRLLWQNRAFPSTEPLMPLSAGVPFIDSAWLSQALGYGMVNQFGNSAIKFYWAGAIALCSALLLWRMYCRTGSTFWTLAGLFLFLGVSYQQFLVVRPQLGGLVCFVALFSLLTARRFPRWGWGAVPLLMLLWANLHGSFIVGIATLGAFCVGRACDVVRRSEHPKALVHDPVVRRYFLLTELGIAATLLNPYGLSLWADVLTFTKNPNLNDLLDWDPLTLRMSQGRAAAVVGLMLVFLYRLTPRRVSVTEALLHIGLAGGALWMSRMIIWWAPIAGYFIALHGHSAWNKGRGGLMLEPIERRSLWTVSALGLLLISFSITPFGGAVLHNRKGTPEAGLSQSTPVRAVEYLKKHPPQGLVFNTQELGDYLLWAGPPGIKVFASSHVHLIPEEVWRDYLVVINLSTDWKETLEQYGVNTIVLDASDRRSLVRALKRDEAWKVAYEDTHSVIFQRRKPI